MMETKAPINKENRTYIPADIVKVSQYDYELNVRYQLMKSQSVYLLWNEGGTARYTFRPFLRMRRFLLRCFSKRLETKRLVEGRK